MKPVRARLSQSQGWAGILLAAGLMGCAVDDPSLGRISHGPILGRVASDSIAVWARTHSPATFRVRYWPVGSTGERVSAPIATTLDSDNTGWGRLEGLEPDTLYAYRLEADGAVPPAATSTFPPPVKLLAPVKL